ncbi:TPA: tlde1 domain-containing protein [Yersinia enterocolitica]
MRAETIHAWHHYRNHHSDWFALFSDKTKKDSLNVNGLNRNGFCLHPLNSDGTGVSWGCITLRRYSDFQHLRRMLLKRGTFPVPGSNGLMAYARIDVRGIPDFSQYGKNTEEKKQTEKRLTQQALRKLTENTE